MKKLHTVQPIRERGKSQICFCNAGRHKTMTPPSQVWQPNSTTAFKWTEMNYYTDREISFVSAQQLRLNSLIFKNINEFSYHNTIKAHVTNPESWTFLRICQSHSWSRNLPKASSQPKSPQPTTENADNSFNPVHNLRTYLTSPYCPCLGSRDSAVGIPTRPQTGRQRNRRSIPSSNKRFIQIIQTGSGAQTASYTMGTRGIFLQRWSDRSMKLVTPI